MWPFNLFKKKEKTQQVPVKETVSMDCVFKSIMADFENGSIDDWQFIYSDHKWEYYKNRKKDYTITCYSRDNTAWLSGIHYDSCFTSSQQRTLYRKCQELWRAQQKVKDDARKVEEQTLLKSMFPKCFN